MFRPALKRPAPAHPSIRLPFSLPRAPVSRCGTVRVLGRQVLVSYTLAGDFARLEKVDKEVFDPCRCFCRIGRSRLRSNRIQDALSRVASSRRQIDLAARALPMS